MNPRASGGGKTKIANKGELMDATSVIRAKVYFDGLCRLCSREIAHYRGMRGAENIEFVDITGPEFDAKREGLDPFLVHRTMHVRDRNGNLRVGVDAFIAIWEELPALRRVVPLARSAAVRPVLDVLYAVFARVRPLLPRKSCADSPYCGIHAK